MLPNVRFAARFVLLCLVALVLLAEVGRAQTEGGEGDDTRGGETVPFLDVVEVDGPIDAPMRDFLDDALDRVQADKRVAALLLRIDTPGTLDEDSFALAERIRDSRVPVIAWVGRESGSALARGGGLLLVAAAHLVAVSPEAKLGPLSPEDLKTGAPTGVAEASRQFEALVPPTRDAAAYVELTSATIDADTALETGVADFEAPFLGAVLAGADGKSAVLATGEVVPLDLTAEAQVEGERTAPPAMVTRFFKLQGVPGFLHKIDTPTYAYVLLVIGLAALVFEYFASSIGIAGGVGGLLLLASFQAMGALPVNWWAVVLMVVAVLLMAWDVQISNLGVLTVVGVVLAIIASIFFTYAADFGVRWWVAGLCLLGLVLFYAVAMTTVVRTRFSTPTIGRDSLLGARGEAASELDPEGLVRIEGATWKARSHRGRITKGRGVTVRAVDGLVLEVDPESD